MRHANGGLRKICGCPRRTWAKCSHSWYLNFKPRGGEAYRLGLDKHLGRHIDSKTDAESEAEKIRIAIRAGTFGQPVPRAEMTLRQLADLYIDRYVKVQRAAREDAYAGALRTVCRAVLPPPTGEPAALGTWRVTEIVTDTIERFRELRASQGLGGIGTDRLLGHLRALFNWSIRTGYLDASPFQRHGLAVVKLTGAHNRARRLDPDADEESKLLTACAPHLRAVVEAAIETGMRRGELLSLQWSQVEGLTVKGSKLTWAARAEMVLPWTKTKTKRDRRIPISGRLRAVLEMRRFDPDGQPLPPDAYVFGNLIGQKVGDIGRAWETAVLKAHGHAPTFTATANLTPEFRQVLAAIDLHFHDLRREAGSRWLEGGVPLHVVRDWLGHTSIAQTSTYLAGSVKVQHDAMHAYEERRKELQRIATGSKTGGRKSARTATRPNRRPNKTAVRRDLPMM